MSSKIILYRGRRGCGKTLSMIKDGLNYKNHGWKVLRNFNCAFGEYISEDDIINLDKGSELYNCVIMIDEIQIFFDARRSMQKQNLNFSNFIQQIRKRNIILLCTTQYSNNLDLRLRQHTDIICYPEYIKDLDVCVNTYIDITTLEDNITFMGVQRQPLTYKVVFDATPIFKLYQTQEMIK